MDAQSMSTLDTIEAQTLQVVNDYQTLGWTRAAKDADDWLDTLLASVHALDKHFTGLGLTLALAGDNETLY